MSTEHSEHHPEHHPGHHPVHEHGGSGSGKEKILGFELKTIVLLFVLILGTAIIATWVGVTIGASGQPTAAAPVAIDKVALRTSVDNYFKDNQLAIFGSNKITLSVTDVTDANDGLVSVGYNITDGNNNQPGRFLASSNRVYLVQAVFDLGQKLPVPAAQPATQQASAAPVKSDKPKVDLYVMSFCPYGNQAEDTMLSTYSLLKNQMDFNVHFIVSTSGNTVQSLHGPNEVVEDEKEACVLKDYGTSKWFQVATYVNDNCGSAQSTSCFADAVAKAGGIDANAIDSCVASDGIALMKENEAASNAAGANGSPTLVINGVQTSSVYQYGNSEAYKQAICDSFNAVPGECSQTLSAATTAPAGSCNPAP